MISKGPGFAGAFFVMGVTYSNRPCNRNAIVWSMATLHWGYYSLPAASMILPRMSFLVG